MKVVIVSATEKEIEQVKQKLDPLILQKDIALELSFHNSGVGILASCFSITKMVFEQKPDLVIQAGIAGAFDTAMQLGDVVLVKDEILGDTGVEENGRFKDLFDLNLQLENGYPFTERSLRNPFLAKLNFLSLPEVRGTTINEITTSQQRIDELKTKYQPAIESMEGASLHYCSLITSTPFIQIRAISNYVGERDKSRWKFKESFHNLTEVVTAYIERLKTENTITDKKKKQ